MTLVSECSIQGRRPGFEDAHVFGAVNASGTVISYAAVLDGHGGSNCSRSIARVFETLVAKIKLPNRRKVYPESVASVLRNHFKAFNEQLAKNGHFVTQGTTMCACFAIGETIYFVNLGDSIATWKMVNGESWYKLIDRWLDAAMFDKALKDGINQQDQWIRYRVAPRGEKVYKSTKVHSPQRDLLRIKEMGGFVTYGRLNGNLAVSRSLGDNWSDAVGKDPEVFWVPRRSFDIPYVLLMCDGMFEPYTFWRDFPIEPEAASAAIFQEFEEQLHLSDAATTMARKAFNQNSHDNISLMVLRLWPVSPSRQPKNVFSVQDLDKLPIKDLPSRMTDDKGNTIEGPGPSP
uniref:PPM-type phosphatase domain-containing protein n=1 Tax=Amorphochlora amoebiformis TaxID=1561963 RepID=A0A6T6VUJ0_9EUKA|mmetsp:Transcript_25695/g.40631  ORF Transcript_25695/g.40631 Transcript_25695/m.40631 type:complete len:347 (+) Transcript_25695:1-1041(+)